MVESDLRLFSSQRMPVQETPRALADVSSWGRVKSRKSCPETVSGAL
jgi:hypothetical protein